MNNIKFIWLTLNHNQLLWIKVLFQLVNLLLKKWEIKLFMEINWDNRSKKKSKDNNKKNMKKDYK